jgi:hypothetical protein
MADATDTKAPEAAPAPAAEAAPAPKKAPTAADLVSLLKEATGFLKTHSLNGAELAERIEALFK